MDAADAYLYDYLAAFQFWNQGASYDLVDDGFRLDIKDSKLFAQGIQRFQQGQIKKLLAFGEAGFPAIDDFLRHSKIPLHDQAEVAVSRLMTSRQSSLFMQLWRWLEYQADTYAQQGDAANEAAETREQIRLFDQVTETGEALSVVSIKNFRRLWEASALRLRSLAEKHPELVSGAEIAQINAQDRSRRIRSKSLVVALTELADARGENQPLVIGFPIFISAIAQSSASLLLIGGIFVWFWGKRLGKSQEEGLPTFGMLRHGCAWSVGYGTVFAVLGLAPAEVVGRDVQRWTIYTLIWLLVLAIVIFCLRFMMRFLRQRKFQFSLFELFVVVSLSAVLLGLWPILRMAFAALDGYPPELWIHAHGWKNIDAEVLRTALKVTKGSWEWAVIQWLSHVGLYVSLAVSLGIVAIWYAWRCSRAESKSLFRYWTSARSVRWGGLLRCVGGSAMVMGYCCLFGYLWLAPGTLPQAEISYQYKMSYCRDPEQHYANIEAVRVKVEASGETMAIIRQEVEDEMTEIEEE